MKTKLSVLSMALLPSLAMASIQIENTKEPAFKSDSIIVVYKDNASALQKREARQLVLGKISDLNKDEIDDKFRNINGGRMANYKLSGISAKDAIAKLKNHPAVKYAEPDYIVKAQVTPNDPSYDSLWGLHNEGQTGGTADADIDAPEAWEISTGSSDVIVAVIDTGVDYSHPDLAANMWVNPGEIAGDGLDNDGNGYIDDVHGINAINSSGDPMDDNAHGTHVAGTIGAVGNNNEGVVGVNHEVSIIGCKFLDGAGSGSTSDAIECLNYMVTLKNSGVNVRLTNNSWGGGGSSQAMQDAISANEAADILFIAAAGNSSVDNDSSPHYPSSYENEGVLSVASTTHTDSMSSFSNYGLTSTDLGAPGSSILSTVPGGGYDSFSGTSMATPHVAGAAALVLSVNPDLTHLELKDILMTSGDDNAAMNGTTVSGKRLNVNNALDAADPTPGFKFSVTPVNTTVIAGESAVYTFEVGSIAEWNGDVTLSLDASLETATLSDTTVSPGDTFTLTVDTTSETQWGSYDFTVTGTSGELVKEKTVGLYVYPQGLTDFTYANNTPVDIPDNTPEGITSVISIPDDITVFGSSTYVNITHTWIGDLVVTLTSPAGTTATLHSNAGGSDDNIDQSFASAAFNGESAAGDWTLHVSDHAGQDTGSLNNWALTVTGVGEVLPAAPEADFTAEVDGLQATFTDASTDNNNDITTWAWDFGDGASSSDMNPVHTYAQAGSYEVALTVTDAEGQSDTKVMMVTVTDVVIELDVKRAYKTRLGRMRVDIVWAGSSADMVDIYRNGEKIDTVENNGIYRDRERRVTENTFVYKVCESSGACSEEVTVNF
ncbi:S8 family serine peptidase [Flocculibacter collagenilyticus]|uniref:S8 family serine peptidase n=1 Tax=Flocculibacter collagenilyticus TaxID=2744479 RepID=UPI0018F70E6A|nr:S8 family serine peptidase [Flocculibacter collagenilyticus]